MTTSPPKKKEPTMRQLFPNGKSECLHCKTAYDKIKVIESGWKRIGPHKCVCSDCDQDSD